MAGIVAYLGNDLGSCCLIDISLYYLIHMLPLGPDRMILEQARQ